jgi:hypothetical protein
MEWEQDEQLGSNNAQESASDGNPIHADAQHYGDAEEWLEENPYRYLLFEYIFI